MENERLTKEIQIYLYEIIERIVRFDIHLEEIKEQFYCDNPNKIALIDDYKCCLDNLFKWAISCNNKADNIPTLKKINEFISELHNDYLSILPRPSVPVELTRFERVIRKQIVTLNDNPRDISIATNESTGENTEKDYLCAFKKKLKLEYSNSTENSNKNQDLYSITIPRIDAPNTFRWPSLIHEMCHTLVRDVFGSDDRIKIEYLAYYGENAMENEIFNSFFEKEKGGPDLQSWLTECFCDLFACLLIGPSFYFSQFVVFMNNPIQNSIDSHPTHQFRLALMESLINRRFNGLYEKLLSKHMSVCDNLMEILQKGDEYRYDKMPVLNVVFSSFHQFFQSLFLDNETIKNSPGISERLKGLIRRYVMIREDITEVLTNRLKEGLPIPSLRTLDKDKKYMEIPTYVQEILLSSWLVKLSSDCDKTKTGLIDKVICQLNSVDQNCNQQEIDDLYHDIKKIIVRHDKAVLKSIQVSEWFDMLTGEKQREDEIELCTKGNENKYNPKNILVDQEINELLKSDELKIIPLMYSGQVIEGKERNQLGTTSVDVRLGTSFQVFSPHQSGIIDFITQEGESFFNESSKRIDLDFMDSITIAPRQFMLGHSMEYIKLPNNICGNLEGRSSFARLGLEIHMTAGFIDPGFEGVITFEIYNAGPTTIRLYPGMRIGQIRLEQNNEPRNKYGQKTVKYKGLLEHNLSLQSEDVEVKLIRDYQKK
ncbi:MAG: dCTP deaminase [Bacteroidales bacterium]|nr:dCTP deaminase [Bacteroidales bacterium]